MKTLVVKYTFNDDFDADSEEVGDAVSAALDAMGDICGCGRPGRVCSLEGGSARWITHGTAEYVDERVMRVEEGDE